MVRHDLNSNYNRIAELEADVERARVKEMEWAHMEDELEILRTELHAEKQKVRNLQKNQKDYAQLAEQAADREERLTQEMRENAKAAKEIERLRRELEQARQLAEEQQRAADELRARIDALAAEAAAAGAAPPLRTAAETSSQPKEAAPQPQLTSSSASFAAVAAGGDAAEAPVTVQVEGGGIDLTIRVAQLQKMLTEKTIENERLRLCGIDHAKGVERIKSLKVANRKLHEQFAARVERERETRLELQTEPVSKSLDEIIVGGLELRRDYLSLKHGVSSGKASTAFSASGAFSPRYTSNDETHHNLTFCTSTSRLTALRERSIEVPVSARGCHSARLLSMWTPTGPHRAPCRTPSRPASRAMCQPTRTPDCLLFFFFFSNSFFGGHRPRGSVSKRHKVLTLHGGGGQADCSKRGPKRRSSCIRGSEPERLAHRRRPSRFNQGLIGRSQARRSRSPASGQIERHVEPELGSFAPQQAQIQQSTPAVCRSQKEVLRQN
ncbi:hypothetical protein DIPPA_27354 [Diplonema papillatum]|nr:hypothetical protein DIPPA_17526 [Diplonema papillatum]KAJ9458402.1 hypothetical protein DIPPA_27354 [Diplonema papillatum]